MKLMESIKKEKFIFLCWLMEWMNEKKLKSCPLYGRISFFLCRGRRLCVVSPSLPLFLHSLPSTLNCFSLKKTNCLMKGRRNGWELESIHITFYSAIQKKNCFLLLMEEAAQSTHSFHFIKHKEKQINSFFF